MAETRFHTLLKARITGVAEGRAASLCSGAASDYAKYMYHVGYLEGLNDALKEAEEVERQFDR